MRRSFYAWGVAALLLGSAAAAFQPPPSGVWSSDKKSKPRDHSHRDLIGQVTLPDDGPASGAVVKLKNLRSLEVKSFITQADGKYSFQNLNSNMDYEVRADLKDMTSGPRKLLVYDTRLDPVINLKLEPAKKPGSQKEEGK